MLHSRVEALIEAYDLEVQRRGGKTWRIRARPYLDAISLALDRL